jgi:hypothetical protein
MTTTCYGLLLDELGASSRRYFDAADLWHPVKRQVWATPPSEFRHAQAAVIPVDDAHRNPVLGRVLHLERRRVDGSLWAVAELTIEPPSAEVYWSPAVTYLEGGGDVELRSIGLCGRTLVIGARPVTFLRGRLDHSRAVDRWRSQLDPWAYGLLERATMAHRRRKTGDPIYLAESPMLGDSQVRSLTRDEAAHAARYGPQAAHGLTAAEWGVSKIEHGPIVRQILSIT